MTMKLNHTLWTAERLKVEHDLHVLKEVRRTPRSESCCWSWREGSMFADLKRRATQLYLLRAELRGRRHFHPGKSASRAKELLGYAFRDLQRLVVEVPELVEVMVKVQLAG
jgi:hypothetical protein